MVGEGVPNFCHSSEKDLNPKENWKSEKFAKCTPLVQVAVGKHGKEGHSEQIPDSIDKHTRPNI
jgi:hypothetical protein